MFAEAEVCYRRAREIDPADFEACYHLAMVLSIASSSRRPSGSLALMPSLPA